MCQTVKQHKRLVKGNKASSNKPMAITKQDAEKAEIKRIGRIVWTAIAIVYAIIIAVMLS